MTSMSHIHRPMNVQPRRELSIGEILADNPVPRLASVVGYHAGDLRFEETFPNDSVSPRRLLTAVASFNGREIRSKAVNGVPPEQAQALAADQVLEQLERSFGEHPVAGAVFSGVSPSQDLYQLLARLGWGDPVSKVISGDPASSLAFHAHAYVPIRDTVYEAVGTGNSRRAACLEAARKIAGLPELAAVRATAVASGVDDVAFLDSVARKNSGQGSQYLLATCLKPIGVSCLVKVPSGEIHSFHGHADTREHARDVGASRAISWILKQLRRT